MQEKEEGEEGRWEGWNKVESLKEPQRFVRNAFDFSTKSPRKERKGKETRCVVPATEIKNKRKTGEEREREEKCEQKTLHKEVIEKCCTSRRTTVAPPLPPPSAHKAASTSMELLSMLPRRLCPRGESVWLSVGCLVAVKAWQ